MQQCEDLKSKFTHETNQMNARFTQQNQQLEGMHKLKGNVASLKSEISALLNENANLRSANAKLRQNIKQRELQISQADVFISSLQNEVSSSRMVIILIFFVNRSDKFSVRFIHFVMHNLNPKKYFLNNGFLAGLSDWCKKVALLRTHSYGHAVYHIINTDRKKLLILKKIVDYLQ